ncbi:MAG: hypothetical protein NZ733_01925 [Aigarchaeota archaeon]|nr:hypothetical protein [Aigarchaeota archaeon]MDW8043469.1 hypothetical protein [Nitrososphaerota archaeon]
MRAVVDASFLMRSVELGRDLIEAVSERIGEPVVPYTVPQVIDELRRLSSGKGVKAAKARAALEVAKGIEVVEVGERDAPADRILVELSRERGDVVLTSDLGVMRAVLRGGGRAALVTEEGEVKLVL